MAYLILHHDGAYNLYNQVSDGPVYRQALTLQQLKVAIRLLHGEAGLHALPSRLERAHKFGSSGLYDTTLAQAIAANRAGRSERTLPLSEFIKEYLTLPGVATTRSAEMETQAVNTPVDSTAGALSYVHVVPDHCDRIVWRSAYFHLDTLMLNNATAESSASK